jgi:pimeloyl-ACP methyl ester carboxylesterase/DNA-binding winged helix-turn-helix (wHTH) protein
LDAPRSSESGRSEVVNLAHEENFMLGPAEVRPSTREILCEDRSLIIEPLAMQVLVVLARADGEVVSRDDLIDQCWGGRIVTEDAVTRVLSQVRRAAAELCENAFTVQTIRSVGCRLVLDNRGAGHHDSCSALPLRRNSDVLRKQQRISFCQADDGVTLAYGRLGKGAPLVKVPNWYGHLEHEIENPIWRHWIHELSSRNMLLRYDQRGSGMSEWNVPSVDFDRLVADLTTVVDTAGLERFDLIAMSQGTLAAIAFAARYPQRVGKLVLINSFAFGWRHSSDPAHVESWDAMCTLIRTGWGKRNLALQKVFTHQCLPDGTPEQWDWLNEFQERTASAEYAYRILQMFGSVDVRELLPKVQAPTLVMHCRDDQIVLPERGLFIASKIPGAQFVALDGRNHLPQPQDASWPQIQSELRQFLS